MYEDDLLEKKMQSMKSLVSGEFTSKSLAIGLYKQHLGSSLEMGWFLEEGCNCSRWLPIL